MSYLLCVWINLLQKVMTAYLNIQNSTTNWPGGGGVIIIQLKRYVKTGYFSANYI